MKTKHSNLWSIASLMIAFLAFTSCGGDDEPSVPEPSAEFSHSIDGKTATFVDASTDAESYAWDFGDGNTSTQTSPTHTYEGNGSYVVKLTVTNASGEDSKQAVLEIVNITIDGDFSDWDNVASINTGGGTLTSVKVENLGNTKLFIYVEGTDEITDLTQIMLNADNDKSTGAFINWLYTESGEDVLIEGNIPGGDEQYGAIYKCEPCDNSTPGNWNWSGTPSNENIADFIEASPIANVSAGKAYELAIDLTALGTPIGDNGIGIAILDISLDTWGPIGAVPALFNENDNPTATLIDYTFK